MTYVTNCAIILRQIAQFAIWLLNLDIAQEPCAISRLLCIIRIPKMRCAIPGFYDTDFALGFILHRRMSRHDRDLASARTASRQLALEFSSRRKPRLWPLFQ